MPLLKPSPFFTLLKKEISFLFSTKAFVVSIFILSPLIGYSFLQATELFSEASRSALQSEDLARGMNPFEGIFVPTFGALYLFSTFVFPFVAIRLISDERQTGSLKLLLQLPVSPLEILTAKLLSVIAAWFTLILPALSVIPLWKFFGGHVVNAEVLNLLLGHFLYALVVIAFAFFVSSFSDSSSTAAILVLAFTCSAWILDFNLLGNAASFSLTASLRSFERGLFSSKELSVLILLSLLFSYFSFLLIQLGRSFFWKLKRIVMGVITALVLFGVFNTAAFSIDVREDKRNSFAAEDEKALSQMTSPLSIVVYMTPDDSRYKDFERKVLLKLKRTVPHTQLTFGDTGKTGFFAAGETSNYGKIVISYGEKSETTLSNSPEEILPILYRLSERDAPKKTVVNYPGFPLVAQLGHWDLLFYFGFPLLFLGLWWALKNYKGLFMRCVL